MENKNQRQLTPMTAIDGLQLLFIGLKLSGHIDWSWWFVLAPWIISVASGIYIKMTQQ